MIVALPLPERTQSLGEEIANSISHGVALLAVVSATPFLIIAAVDRGGVADIVGASVFAVTMLLLYLTSTLYHALPRNKAKRVFQILDYGAIYLLIAGTYTPFTLGVLRGAWGWTLLSVWCGVWPWSVFYLRLSAGCATQRSRPACTWPWAGWYSLR